MQYLVHRERKSKSGEVPSEQGLRKSTGGSDDLDPGEFLQMSSQEMKDGDRHKTQESGYNSSLSPPLL